MADARLGLGPLPPAPPRYERVNEQAFRQQMDSLRRSVEQYVASSRNALEAEIEGTALGDLADVTETSVADGEVLQYDSGTSEWINQTLAEAGIAAAAHTHTESDITDLDHYDDADADARIALATLADLASADASELDAGVLADARVQESNVTQHQAALSLTESQISDLAHFSGDAADLTGELADARLSDNVPLLDASNVFGISQTIEGNLTVQDAGVTPRLELERTGTAAGSARIGVASTGMFIGSPIGGSFNTGSPLILDVGAPTPAANETNVQIRHNAGGGGAATERISIGAADSGGAGFRVLRIPN